MKSVKKGINYYYKMVKQIPFLVILGIEILSAILSLLCAATDMLKAIPTSIINFIYIVAACSLLLLVCRIVLFLQYSQWKQRIKEYVHRWTFTGKMADDYSFRTVTLASVSFTLNMILAVSKGIIGWFSSSIWMITFAAYYLILSISKLILLSAKFKLRKTNDSKRCEITEWKAYRLCGVLFMMLTVVLQGMVVLIMKTGSPFYYHEVLLLMIATVDFYSLISSILYMVRNRGAHSPIIVAIKNISLASSFVSILSLQTAMFTTYGENTDLYQKNFMNLLSGSAVCFLLLIFGVYMVWNAGKHIKQLNG